MLSHSYNWQLFQLHSIPEWTWRHQIASHCFSCQAHLKRSSNQKTFQKKKKRLILPPDQLIGTQQHDEIPLRIIRPLMSPFFSKMICNNVCFRSLLICSQTFVSKLQFGFRLCGRRPTGDMCTHMSKVHKIQNRLQTLPFWSLGDCFPLVLVQAQFNLYN